MRVVSGGLSDRKNFLTPDLSNKVLKVCGLHPDLMGLCFSFTLFHQLAKDGVSGCS